MSVFALKTNAHGELLHERSCFLVARRWKREVNCNTKTIDDNTPLPSRTLRADDAPASIIRTNTSGRFECQPFPEGTEGGGVGPFGRNEREDDGVSVCGDGSISFVCMYLYVCK